MNYFYLLCALVGGVLFIIQFLLSLIGHGGDHGLDGHVESHPGGDVGHDTTIFTGIISLRAMVAGLTVFGLTGMLCLAGKKIGPLLSLPIAIGAAFVVMFFIALILRSFMHLSDEGTALIENAMGKPGTVYLPIPGQRGGLGKVTVILQNRTVEYQAMTAREPLAAGTKVNVIKVIGADTVEVVPATSSESVS